MVAIFWHFYPRMAKKDISNIQEAKESSKENYPLGAKYFCPRSQNRPTSVDVDVAICYCGVKTRYL